MSDYDGLGGFIGGLYGASLGQMYSSPSDYERRRRAIGGIGKTGYDGLRDIDPFDVLANQNQIRSGLSATERQALIGLSSDHDIKEESKFDKPKKRFDSPYYRVSKKC